MKKALKYFLLAAIALPLTFQSCVVEEDDDEAKLEIFVQKDGTSVYGAMVRLYMNEDDFKAQNDNYSNGKETDLLGYALFTGLPARQYYISVVYDGTYDSYDNFSGNYDMVSTQLGARLNETIDIQLATELTVVVKDLANMGLSDAIVKLYDNESDMINATNALATEETIASGQAKFSHLFEQEYFYSVTVDGVTNNYSTESALTASTNNMNYITFDPNNSALVVKVFENETSNTIENAVVTLYETEEAWRNRTPAANIDENNVETDQDGEALFYNLGEKQYYIGVIYEDGNFSYDNNTGLHYMETPTQLGESTQINIDIKAATKLEITVQDIDGTPINNAAVKLYNTEADVLNNENMIGSIQYTSSNGVVLFNHLFPQVYYFSVSANGETINYYTENPLTESTTDQITVTLDPYSYLTIFVEEKSTGNAVPTASVKLFTTEEAWNAGTPLYNHTSTNNSGEAYFHELEPQQYYVQAYTNILNNNNGDDADLGELLPGTEYYMTVRISQNKEKGNANAKTIVDVKSKKRLIKVANGR
ncbi:MAG: carboxypeptidase-like regulatory domain-containing protein [Salinivirgaceae bacterium]